MTRIPIKVKKKGALEMEVADDLRVNLRPWPPKFCQTKLGRPGAELEEKQPSFFSKRAGLFLAILVIIILVCLVNWFFKPSPAIPLAKIIPQEAIVLSLIDKDALYGQILPFYGTLQEQSPFYQWLMAEINRYLSQADLDFQQDIQPLFKKQLGLALFPANDQTDFPFVILLQKQAGSAQINRILGQIELVLKKDFHLSSQIYRQIKIISCQSLSSPHSFYYSQIEDYFLIGNSIDWLEKVIDLIIKE